MNRLEWLANIIDRFESHVSPLGNSSAVGSLSKGPRYCVIDLEILCFMKLRVCCVKKRLISAYKVYNFKRNGYLSTYNPHFSYTFIYRL
ncbi:hypothetical protein Aduo_017085 [Ancylostoma duodenale]